MAKETEQRQLNVFYSYSHKDANLRDVLKRHLTVLKRQGVIKEWYDREILAGEEWEKEINEQLENADIILLLVSQDFLDSRFIWEKEMAKALERHKEGKARVIPILIRPSDWERTPLKEIEPLPKTYKPITEWKNKDRAWVTVSQGIWEVVDELAAGRTIKELPKTSNQATPLLPSPVQETNKRLAERAGGQPTRTIYNVDNSESLSGMIARKEGDPATGDPAVDEAYDAIGHAYYFFWDIYKRDSIDGKGMPLNAVVHYGRDYLNAFWTGKEMVVGDGDGRIFSRFTASIDVIGKEYSNGVIGSETKLDYWEESGALFNSLATVFAVLIKQYALKQTAIKADWLLGTELMVPALNARALSSLANPGTAYDDPLLGKDIQPAHMDDYVHTKNDSGGIHINSGIPDHAFYRIAMALGGYAWEKAGRIWYEAIRDENIKPKSSFSEFAKITYANARRLYGEGSAEAQAVQKGWKDVGITIEAK